MSDIPDWLWQNLVANLLADGLVTAGWLAWKYRKEIAQRLRPPRTIRYTVTDKLRLADSASVQTLTGGGTSSLAQAGGGSLRVIRPYGAFPTGRAGTPTLRVQEGAVLSLARRLEELASWYLHVS